MRRAALICLFLAGCEDKGGGEGIGYPPAQAGVRPILLPITLTEVFVATTDATQAFAELALEARSCTADADCSGGTCADGVCAQVALDTTSLCSADACVVLAGTLLPDVRASFSLEQLALGASVGELHLVDANGDSHAVFAWGADPATLGSSQWAAAVVRGAARAGEFVAVGYPVPDGVAVARQANQGGCALPSRDANATLDAALCSTATGTLELTEVAPQLAADADSWVEVLNTTAAALDLGGVRICQPPSCSVVPVGTQLAAGQRLVLHTGVPGLTVDASHLRDDAAAPIAAAGELAVLAPGAADIADSTRLLSFVRYGDITGTLVDAAVIARLWPDANATAAAPTVSGEVLVLLGPPGTPSSWQVWGVASPGM